MQFRVQLANAGRRHVDHLPRRPVAMVLGEMRDQRTARDLHVERPLIVEPVLPVDATPDIADVELTGISCPSRPTKAKNPVSTRSPSLPNMVARLTPGRSK